MHQNHPSIRPDNQPVGGFPNIFYAARQALRTHATGGNLLIAATVLALLIANIPAVNSYYFHFWTQEVRLQVGSFNVFSHGGHPMDLLAFINDALMAVFFFSIGLEIKREILVGELASFRQALLPIIAAVGGMIVPVAVFFLFAHGTDYAGGAAIPMATDIAFSLGVLTMLGKRVPVSLKIFLTTLAVVDDIGGIIVIAAFYSSHIEVSFLIIAAFVLLAMIIGGSVLKIQSQMFYLFLSAVVWFLFLNSGIHPTIAGVLAAFTIPSQPVYEPKKYISRIKKAMTHFGQESEDAEAMHAKTILSHEQMNWLKQVESASDKVISPLQQLEDNIHPLVDYIILPLFAFANAGILLLGMEPASALEGISLAIICGLVGGKFLGIFTFSWLTVKMKLAPMPARSTWPMMASVAVLGGIGFTVSIFIATLTFTGTDAQSLNLLLHAKLGIVLASILAGVGAYLLLHVTLPKESQDEEYES